MPAVLYRTVLKKDIAKIETIPKVETKVETEEKNPMDKRMNLTMLTDFYEITMANGYFQSGSIEDDIAYFDMFFRRVPDEGGFAIMAGLEQLIEYLKHLEFTDEEK